MYPHRSNFPKDTENEKKTIAIEYFLSKIGCSLNAALFRRLTELEIYNRTQFVAPICLWIWAHGTYTAVISLKTVEKYFCKVTCNVNSAEEGFNM